MAHVWFSLYATTDEAVARRGRLVSCFGWRSAASQLSAGGRVETASSDQCGSVAGEAPCSISCAETRQTPRRRPNRPSSNDRRAPVPTGKYSKQACSQVGALGAIAHSAGPIAPSGASFCTLRTSFCTYLCTLYALYLDTDSRHCCCPVLRTILLMALYPLGF